MRLLTNYEAESMAKKLDENITNTFICLENVSKAHINCFTCSLKKHKLYVAFDFGL